MLTTKERGRKVFDMAQGLIPFTTRQLPASTPGAELPGMTQVVFFTLPADMTEMILQKVANWFIDRPEVRYADHGTTDKEGHGFIVLEWSECEVDPLFLAILREEEFFLDYTTFTREGI